MTRREIRKKYQLMVKKLIEAGKYIDDSHYQFRDDSNKIIVIDVVNGLSGRLENGKVIYNTPGYLRSKNNGYAYTCINIKKNGKVAEPYILGTHDVIALITQGDVYDSYIEDGEVPICNHKNNVPWDNRHTNLEWVSYSDNCWHRVVVDMLEKHFGSDIIEIVRNNNIEKKFRRLKIPISVMDLYDYYWHTEDMRIFEPTKMYRKDWIAFIDWVSDRNNSLERNVV